MKKVKIFTTNISKKITIKKNKKKLIKKKKNIEHNNINLNNKD
jgi:hypothetical protein